MYLRHKDTDPFHAVALSRGHINTRTRRVSGEFRGSTISEAPNLQQEAWRYARNSLTCTVMKTLNLEFYVNTRNEFKRPPSHQISTVEEKNTGIILLPCTGNKNSNQTRIKPQAAKVALTANMYAGNKEESIFAEPAVQSFTCSRRLVVQPR